MIVMGVRKRKRERQKAEIQRLTSILAVIDSPHLKEKGILWEGSEAGAAAQEHRDIYGSRHCSI